MKMKKVVKRSLELCLVFGFLSCVTSNSIFRDSGRYEGNSCRISSDNSQGTCVNISECPHQIVAVREGKYNKEDRCGFVGETEIVCCNVTIGNKSKNPADAACEEYGNEVLPTDSSMVGLYILGGVRAEAKEFPFIAALGYEARSDNGNIEIRYTCGGTLISPKHVLTAAHCVNNRDERVPVEVRLGSTDLNATDETVQRIKVASVMSHPDYRRSTNYDDVAILTLEKRIQRTSSVKPVCLLTRSKGSLNPAENETLVIAGWGVTSIDFSETMKLRKAAGLNFVDRNECDRHYESDKATRMTRGVDDKMICVIDTNRTRGADTCLGDSGGPLLLYSGSSYTLAGITAFGKACGSSVPSVYMSVYSYMDWIQKHVWLNDVNAQ